MSAASVYRFDQLDEVEKEQVGGLGRGPWSARRQGREPGGDDPARDSRTARLHSHDPGLSALSGRRQHHAGRKCGSR